MHHSLKSGISWMHFAVSTQAVLSSHFVLPLATNCLGPWSSTAGIAADCSYPSSLPALVLMSTLVRQSRTSGHFSASGWHLLSVLHVSIDL